MHSTRAFEQAHDPGMFTMLWCYLRNNAFKKDDVDYRTSSCLSSKANHRGVTIEADEGRQLSARRDTGCLSGKENHHSLRATLKILFHGTWGILACKDIALDDSIRSLPV